MALRSSESWGYARWLVNRAYAMLQDPDEFGGGLWELTVQKWTDVPDYDEARIKDAEELRTEFV